MSNTLFRKTSLDSLNSPEQLNDYIRVSNPGVWIVLSALFVLLAAALVWGLTGRLPTVVRAEGVASGGSVVCYVDASDAAKLAVGQRAVMDERNGQPERQGAVAFIGDVPMSPAEIAAELGSDYLAQALIRSAFAVKVTVTPGNAGIADGTLLGLGIVTESERPFDFLVK